jgi:uncharacterized protein (TIGR02246 family)
MGSTRLRMNIMNRQGVTMQSDEAQIRELVTTWMAASKAGDVDTVLSLMTDDVVFLVPGQAPMHKPAFDAASRAQSSGTAPKINSTTSEIQEIKVAGDWAFMWTKLSIVVTPPNSASSIERAGHTLTVLKKENGKWLLARDANLLAVVQKPST